MSLAESHILLIGAGKMGGALLAAWLHKLHPKSITVLEPHSIATVEGANWIRSLDEFKTSPDIVVLAVKPQSMEALLPQLACKLDGKPLYLSIAAGKTLAYYEKHLGDAPVVRAMPNTPALIRKGITALIANDKVTEAQKSVATGLMHAAGETVWLEDESQMDAVTAISGSGPAYVFLFLEALIAAGMKQGLSEAMAKKLALQTLHGSTKLAQKSDESLAQLRKNVTSPGGTTEAALKVLMQGQGLSQLIQDAIAANIKRNRELA